jgi:hypothetical protein
MMVEKYMHNANGSVMSVSDQVPVTHDREGFEALDYHTTGGLIGSDTATGVVVAEVPVGGKIFSISCKSEVSEGNSFYFGSLHSRMTAEGEKRLRDMFAKAFECRGRRPPRGQRAYT